MLKCTPRSLTGTSSWPATSPGSARSWTPLIHPTTSADSEELAAVQRYRSRPMAVLTGWPTGSLSSLSSRKASIVEPLNWRCGSCPSNGGRSDLVRLVLTTPHRTTLSQLTGNRLRPIWWARVVHQTEPTDDQAGDEPAV